MDGNDAEKNVINFMFCAKYYEKNALFDKICVTLQPVTIREVLYIHNKYGTITRKIQELS